ncbi:hypothetical protein Lepto7376_0816 [[Leptolyngbya] sp. PCC 7376]|nr:hypothetical protein Lepto7376_0816 [[Leptolyngbya] sp. PCC 7376]
MLDPSRVTIKFFNIFWILPVSFIVTGLEISARSRLTLFVVLSTATQTKTVDCGDGLFLDCYFRTVPCILLRSLNQMVDQPIIVAIATIICILLTFVFLNFYLTE